VSTTRATGAPTTPRACSARCGHRRARSGRGGVHNARYKRADNPARRAVFKGQIRPRSGASYQARILALLASDPERWWIGRDIAAALDIPAGGAYSALHALNERAEVERRARGKLYTYRHKA